jgi:hypothetical protein
MCPTATTASTALGLRAADFSLTFPPDPLWIKACRDLVRTSVHTVRRAASATLRELAETAALLTSEAATNAVTATTLAGCVQPITLYGEWLAHGRLRIHVQDGAPGVPHVVAPADEAEHGRGLQLISALSTRYGFCADGPGPGKSVWFQLEHPKESAA